MIRYTIKRSSINKISRYCYGAVPVSIKRLHSNSNIIFKLIFKDSAKVIKIDMSRDGWRVRKEMHLLKMLKVHRIPVPEVEFFDTSEIVIAYDWYIMEYLGDHNLNDIYRKNKKLSRKLFYELGRIMARMHKIRFNEQGNITPDGIEKKTLHESYKQTFERAMKNLLLHNQLTRDEAELANSAFKNFHISDKKCLCHDDFAPWHAIVSKNIIKGIVDWEWARSSYPMYDLAKTELLMSIWSGNIDVFENGYNSICRLPKDFEKIKRTYQIVEAVKLMNFFIDNEKNLKKSKQALLRLLNS